jgi:ABC-type glutathione transport system ATPase component
MPVRSNHRLAIVEVENVSKNFGNTRANSKRGLAVDGVSLTIDYTTRLGIVGESGSGKSTLSRIIVGLETPTSGRVAYRGLDVSGMAPSVMREFRKNVQMISQDTSSSFDPAHTLRDSVRRPAQELLGLDKSKADAVVDETLAMVGIGPQMVDRRPADVSGGQRQRIAIARALVVKPALILCDEVVSALDVSVQGTVLNLLKAYCDENEAGLLFVSHGLPATAFVSKDIAVMRNGVIVEQGPVDDVINHSKNPYTETLIEAYHWSARPLIPRSAAGGLPLEEAVR